MLELKITDQMYRLAWAKNRDMEKLKKPSSISKYLGEIVAHHFIKGFIVNTNDYSIISPNNLKIDVKTKKCDSEPLPHYECSIETSELSQNCDFYAFVRVECINNNYTRAWYLGHIDKDAYYYNARKLLKGQKDGDNWFTIKSDCYNIPISSLSLDFGVFNEQ